MKREEAAANRKWKTEHIFASVKEWNEFYDEVIKRIDFSRFEGKLGDPVVLKECYLSVYSVLADIEKLSVYAFMRHD